MVGVVGSSPIAPTNSADNPVRAVIFDLDGTLIDTAVEIEVALNATMGQLELPHLRRSAVEALIGRGVRSLIERALEQAGARAIDIDRAVERFLIHYTAVVATQAVLFPGVLEGLRTMYAADVKLAVVTNKPRFFTERLLAKLGVDSMMSTVVAGDDGVRRKPRGDMLIAACRAMGVDIDSALMIGDSDNDVLAAREAGCRVWCVPYGYNEGRGPETLKCDRIVATVEEAARLITHVR